MTTKPAQTVREAYLAIRTERPNDPARYAIQWARDSVETNQIARACEWRDVFDSHTLAIASYEGLEITAYVDDHVFDWGDIEPSEDERYSLEVIGVGVRVAGEDDNLDEIWGVGYLSGDFQRQAIETAVEYGFVQLGLREIAERAYWAARDIATVST